MRVKALTLANVRMYAVLRARGADLRVANNQGDRGPQVAQMIKNKYMEN